MLVVRSLMFNELLDFELRTHLAKKTLTYRFIRNQISLVVGDNSHDMAMGQYSELA